MRVLVTGSSGHLGEALVRVLTGQGHEVVGVDIAASTTTTHVGSISNRAFIAEVIRDVKCIYHTATLHKPHIVSHSNQQFIDVNITGTLVLLESAVQAGCEAFVFTSSTSVFGDALKPAHDMPAVWINESVTHIPKNIYGVTKAAAEDLCQLFFKLHNLPCIVLRASRFYAEEDDDDFISTQYTHPNMKVIEYLYRRIDISDVVSAHLLAGERAATLGFKKYVISATTPFVCSDVGALRADAPSVVEAYFPEYRAEFARRGWSMFPSFDRVYDNSLARSELGWEPYFDFRRVLTILRSRMTTDDYFLFSELAQQIGSKGYGNKQQCIAQDSATASH